LSKTAVVDDNFSHYKSLEELGVIADEELIHLLIDKRGPTYNKRMLRVACAGYGFVLPSANLTRLRPAGRWGRFALWQSICTP
jgi:hypothetical protein